MYSAINRLILCLALGLTCFLIGNAQAGPGQPQAIAPRSEGVETDTTVDLLPRSFGDFKASGFANSLKPELIPDLPPTLINQFGKLSARSRSYTSKSYQFQITVISAANDSTAYSLLTHAKRVLTSSGEAALGSEVGTASLALPDKLLFVKGPVLVVITERDKTSLDKPSSHDYVSLARAFADTLDKGEGELPVLVKHLPNWQNVKGEALYAVSLENLKAAVSNQPVFDAISFEGSAHAVIAPYDQSRMVIVEFNTPQLATDNDQRINAKLQELRSQGQPLPTAYRRVGNYAVFVFDAASPEAANALIDQVKYEQMVQWLGRNPYLYERALREFTQPILGAFVNVVKGSGLALVICLAVGGLFGGLLFIRRRAQQRESEAYSDSGGMLRLNLDELTAETDPGKMLSSGK